MSKKSNLIHQAKKSLTKQCHYGESKHEAKQKAKEEALRTGEKIEPIKGIYSTETYNSYSKSCKQFIGFVLENHGKEVKNYGDCKEFVPEFLQDQLNRGNSPWTIHLHGSALGCSYGCSLRDFDFEYPERSRSAIKRCRDINSSDYRYPQERYDLVKDVLRATGCRRAELLRLTKDSFRTTEDGHMEVLKDGKGGIQRWCLVDPKYQSFMEDFLKTVEPHRINGEDRLFLKAELPRGSIHDLRADYAASLYHYFEEEGKGNGNLYHCRGEMAGKHYDKGILELVSYNLQHTRNSVVVNHYLWKMK